MRVSVLNSRALRQPRTQISGKLIVLLILCFVIPGNNTALLDESETLTRDCEIIEDKRFPGCYDQVKVRTKSRLAHSLSLIHSFALSLTLTLIHSLSLIHSLTHSHSLFHSLFASFPQASHYISSLISTVAEKKLGGGLLLS